MMHPDLATILISEEEVDSIVRRIAAQIDKDYADKNKKLVLLCILKGSVVFMGELMKRITVPVEIDFMKVSSYGGSTVSSGRVNIILDILRGDLVRRDQDPALATWEPSVTGAPRLYRPELPQLGTLPDGFRVTE